MSEKEAVNISLVLFQTILSDVFKEEIADTVDALYRTC